MRILHINCEFPPMIGGGAAEAFLLYSELAKHHEVSVLTTGPKDSPREEILNGMRIFRCPVMNPWSGPGHVGLSSLLSFVVSSVITAKRLRKELEDIDIINSWFAIPTGLSSPSIARFLKKTSLLTLCGGDVYDPVKLMAPNRNPITRLLAKRAVFSHDHISAISQDLAKRAQQTFNYHQPIHVIPMGVDLSLYKTKMEFHDNPRPFRWVTACRLVKRKGLHAVLKAMSQIKEYDFVFHIIGDGPQKNELLAQAEKLGLGGRIIFEGQVDETRKIDLESSAHAFILCSFHEGQCQAILEAAALGLPIITGDVGGQTEMIKNHETGLLCRAGEPDSIASAIRSVMDSPSLRRNLRDAALKVVEAYSVTNTSTKYEELFRSLIVPAPAQTGMRIA